MTPRRLTLTKAALADLAARDRTLCRARGEAFADAWAVSFLDWLRGRAESGAQIGTAHPRHPEFRTFGYRRQATVLVEFSPDELRVVRVYFAGQDWTR